MVSTRCNVKSAFRTWVRFPPSPPLITGAIKMEDLEPRQVMILHLCKIIEDNASDAEILSMIQAFEEEDQEPTLIAETSSAIH